MNGTFHGSIYFIFGINISCYCSDMFRLYDHFQANKITEMQSIKKKLKLCVRWCEIYNLAAF